MPTDEPLHPLVFEPLYRQYVWGGRRLVEQFGRNGPTSGPVAESWDIVDREDSQSIVAHGPLTGLSLGHLCRERHREVFGPHAVAYGGDRRSFPLLVKFLDAEQDLSVQVHPDDSAAASLSPPDRGKSEAWYVIASRPNSRVHLGLREGTDPFSLRRSIDSGSIDHVLATRRSRAGDCYYLPAGTVHALGAGNLVAEIQQSSDVTYRLHDWNRLGSDGRPRTLHVEAGLAAVRSFTPVGAVERRGTSDPCTHRLVECPHFTLEEVRPTGQWTAGTGGTAEILICVSGSFQLEDRWNMPRIPTGGTVLLPAAIGHQTILAETDSILLRATLPTTAA